jgi:WD40 repeat protein
MGVLLGVAVTKDRFIAIDAYGSLVTRVRPLMHEKSLDRPCADDNSATAIAVANAGPRVVLQCEHGGLRVVDLDTGARVDAPHLDTSARAVAWSPDGTHLATRDYRGTIHVWTAAGDKLLRTIATRGYQEQSLSWLSNDELAGAQEEKPFAWKVADGSERKLEGVGDDLATHATAAGGGRTLIAAISNDRNGVADHVFVLGAGEIEVPGSQLFWIHGISIDDAGEHAVMWRSSDSGHADQEVVELDVTHKTSKVIKTEVHTAVMGPRAAWLAGSGHAIVRHDPDGSTHAVGELPDAVTALAVHGDIVAAGAADGTLALFSMAGAPLATAHAHDSTIFGLGFAPDGMHLASTANDGTLIWDLTP